MDMSDRPEPESSAAHGQPLSEDGKAVVDDEVGMAARVARRIARSLTQQAAPAQAPGRIAYDAELVALRDQIGEARAEDVPALMAQMMRVAAVAQVDGPKAEGRVDPRVPYFGHLRLEEAGRKRDVLIGKRSMVDRESGVVIVDWRNAPVSRIYYRYDEGDEYEEEFGEQVRDGEVLVRRTVSFSDGTLTRVSCPMGTFVFRPRGDTSEWIALPKFATPELKGGVGVAARAPTKSSAGTKSARRLGHMGDAHLRPDKHLPEIAALIDRAQFDAMTQTDAGVVVLQGGAGSGKTTVALHRIAWLAFQDAQHFRPRHMMVVVQQPALVRYVERVLPSLEVGGVRVTSYGDWARYAVSRLLPKHGRRTFEDVPSEVSRFKKHPGILQAIENQLAQRVAAFEDALGQQLQGRAQGGMVLDAWATRHLRTAFLPRLESFVHWLHAAEITQDTRERALRVVENARNRVRNLVEEWEELITDRALLAPCCEGPAALPPRVFDEALRFTKQQIQEPEDLEGVDESAKRPVDARDEAAEDPRQTFDPHDFPILLNLWIARTGGLFGTGAESSRELLYDHIAIDEAQDLSAVEMKPLLLATGPRRSLTLAGDIVQKVIFDNGFDDWETLLTQLGTAGTRVEPFRLTYRSTAEIIEFARDVLGPLAPPEPPQAVRTGAPVEVFSFDDPGEELAFLAENLRSVMGREPQANIAVLTRYPERASFYAARLEEAEVPRLRLVDGPEFSFAPGIDVTHISQVKGLEYDYVVLVEATQAMYPDELAARHLLHIGATRAAYQLWVTTIRGQESPLVPWARFAGRSI